MDFTTGERNIINAAGKIIANKLLEANMTDMMAVSFITHDGGDINLVPISKFVFTDFNTQNVLKLKSIHSFVFATVPPELYSVTAFINAWVNLAKKALNITDVSINGNYVRIKYILDENAHEFTAFYHVTDTHDTIISEYLTHNTHNAFTAFLQKQMSKYFISL